MRWYFWQLSFNVFKCPTNKFKNFICLTMAWDIKFKFGSLIKGYHFAVIDKIITQLST